MILDFSFAALAKTIRRCADHSGQLGNRQQNSAAMSDLVIALALAAWVYAAIAAAPARADNGNPTSQAQSDLVNQANAPISSVFQIRLQDDTRRLFRADCTGRATSFQSQ